MSTLLGSVNENLPARAVRHLVDTKLNAFLREMLLHGLEATAAESDMIDDAGVGPLRVSVGEMSLRCSTGCPSL